jgi:hypothetical protein
LTPYLKLSWPETPPVDQAWLQSLTMTSQTPVYMWNFGSTQEVSYSSEFTEVFDGRVVKPYPELANINIDYVQIFSTDPGHHRAIHSDGRGQEGERDWAINWVDPACDNHWMIWYQPKDSALINDTVKMTAAGTPYLQYLLKDCREIARVRIQGYYLINTSIPHTVVNRGTGPRVAVSLRCRAATVTYQELYDRLSRDR